MTVAGWAAAALLSFSIAWLWRHWALRRGVLDVPGQRSSHATPTPRGGGVGLWLAMLAALLVAQPLGQANTGVVVGLALAGLVGFIDDLRPLSPAMKLAGQTLAAVALALALPVLLPQGWPGASGPLLAAALALFLMNAWNFMDGIDGIAALCAVSVAAVALIAGGGGLAPWLGAAALGFLPLNAPRARLFMGDCGSHALGFAVAVLVLDAQRPPGAMPDSAGPAVFPLLAACAPFVVDVLGTLAQRARDGERLASAHRRHLYQRLVQCGYSHARVTAAYAGAMLAAGGAVYWIDTTTGGGFPAMLAVYALTAAGWCLLGRRVAAPAEGSAR